jgi:hypothetical protein
MSLSYRPTGIGVGTKSNSKVAQNENAQIKGGKLSGSQQSIRKPFADITNQSKNRTLPTSKPKEKAIKKSEPDDIEYDLTLFRFDLICSQAYFNDYKLPYRIESVENFDVLAYAAQPSSMKPYCPLEEKYSFELIQIDQSLYGTLHCYLLHSLFLF